MNSGPRSSKPNSSTTTVRYAIFIGIIVVLAIAIGTYVGRHAENAKPAGSITSPAP